MARLVIPNDIGEFLKYDAASGLLTWRVKRKAANKGGRAGRVGPRGYAQVGFNRVYYAVHRVAYFLATGLQPSIVDHINGDPFDNRLENLRASNPTRNQQNRALDKRNSTGISGVRFLHQLKSPSWNAGIGINGKFVHLGSFPTLFDAVCARRSSENKFFGSYSSNRGRL